MACELKESGHTLCSCNLSGFPASSFVRSVSLLFVLCFTFASFSSFSLFMLAGSKLSTSADLPGLRNPFLNVLEKFLRPLKGLVK